jgi:hypothetical protein
MQESQFDKIVWVMVNCYFMSNILLRQHAIGLSHYWVFSVTVNARTTELQTHNLPWFLNQKEFLSFGNLNSRNSVNRQENIVHTCSIVGHFTGGPQKAQGIYGLWRRCSVFTHVFRGVCNYFLTSYGIIVDLTWRVQEINMWFELKLVILMHGVTYKSGICLPHPKYNNQQCTSHQTCNHYCNYKIPCPQSISPSPNLF